MVKMRGCTDTCSGARTKRRGDDMTSQSFSGWTFFRGLGNSAFYAGRSARGLDSSRRARGGKDKQSTSSIAVTGITKCCDETMGRLR